jgi:hypothetical protein
VINAGAAYRGGCVHLNVKSRNVKQHLIKNFFRSDLSKALQNGFHSPSPIVSAILNDGIER